MTCYAFIVGVNQEWPEQRCLLGDIGLARCLIRHCGLPKENLTEVYDDRATRSHVLRALEGLLDRRNETLTQRNGEGCPTSDGADTLLFHYGGHGKRTEFCTQRERVQREGDGTRKEPWLKHSDVIDLLERKFRGGTAVCLVDCCHAGGFGEAVARRRRDRIGGALHVDYLCIMSAAPTDMAGMEWTMSECFIRAFKGELPCFSPGEEGGHCCYLYGKHPKDQWLAPSESTNARRCEAKRKNGTHPTWRQVIDFFVNEMARIKGGRATTLFCGTGTQDGKLLFERPCIFGNNVRETSSNVSARIPRDEAWMAPFRRTRHVVDDWVYVKLPELQYMGWLPGRVLFLGPSKQEGSLANTTTNGDEATAAGGSSTAHIELHDDISQTQWIATLPLNPACPHGTNGNAVVLGGLPFLSGIGFDPLPCARVISHMARTLAYFDTTIPPDVRVRVRWRDGKYYEARTLCRTAIPWEEVDLDSSPAMSGPCVPLRWKDDETVSFVPTAACVVHESEGGTESVSQCEENAVLTEKSSRDSNATLLTPLDAMLASLACDKKKLHGNAPVLSGPAVERDADFWEAYDVEDAKYSRVQLMNKVDPTLLPLKVLAYHMCYRESGNYSVVYWEAESMLSLVPNSYLRQRGPTEDGSDNSSDEDSHVYTTKEADVKEIREYIEQAACNTFFA